MNKIEILEFLFNKEDSTLTIVFHLWVVILIIIAFFGIRWLLKKYVEKNGFVKKEITPVKLKYGVGGVEIEYSIIRNFQNIEIAHRIYIELVTRKAAIEIDKERDVIIEVYNSWYTLFQITRDELKKISGEFLIKEKSTDSLEDLLSDILNKGLRPHLTEYQARFRKWYSIEIEKSENKELSPQEIQKKFKDIDNLMASMVEVNKLLIDYAKQLKIIIKGK
jgi:hypothetical protein